MPREERIMDEILEMIQLWSSLPFSPLTLFFDYLEISVFWSVFLISYIQPLEHVHSIISFDFQMPMDWK